MIPNLVFVTTEIKIGIIGSFFFDKRLNTMKTQKSDYVVKE